MKNKSRISLFRILAIMMLVGGFIASSHAQTSLYTPNPSFNMADHVVSTSFFHWYTSGGGQLSGPWLPRQGRPAWTGEPDWWQEQIKQTMMANIDMLYVHLIPSTEQQRINLFIALNQLRSEGYDVPKIAPFLDPIISWNSQPNPDLATAAGKDDWTDQYIRFFNQYYSVNQDAYADDYIAKFDDRVVLDSWHPQLNLDNVPSFSRSDVMSRLQAEFGSSSVFSNDIYMVSTSLSNPNYNFVDEKIVQFERHEYFYTHLHNGIKTTQVKPGYWDSNVRNPGTLLPRDGGSHYIAAWNSVAGDSALSRVYIESFNEYDEGSGIYAADPTNSPWLKPGSGNTGSDTWSSTDDPFEYLYTTASGAAAFNETPNHDAKILWDDFPLSMLPGSTQTVTVVLRNAGDASWTAAANYKFGDKADGSAAFGASRYLLDDNADEIPLYGGIFRGRAKTFQLTLIAPTTLGTYETHWSMIQEGLEWFGEDLVRTIVVDNTLFAVVTLGDLLQTYDGAGKNASATTAPAGLAVDFTYDGLATPPADPGSYAVIGTVNDVLYTGITNGTLVIEVSAAYDAWKADWFTPAEQADPAISGPEIHHDSDTFSNYEEYVAGTDPTDGQEFPTFQMQPTTLSEYILTWASVSGRVYSVDWSPDLTQGFAPLQENILWPISSYTDQIHQAETEGFYQMNVALPFVTTTASITAESAGGVTDDLFQGATVTADSGMHSAGAFPSSNMFNVGVPFPDAIYADGDGETLSFVEFNTANSVKLRHIVVGLANDHIAGDNNDARALNNIKVYAGVAPGIVQDNLIADIEVNSEYTTAYGGNEITVAFDVVANAQYFRVEFTESHLTTGVRIMEVDGFTE